MGRAPTSGPMEMSMWATLRMMSSMDKAISPMQMGGSIRAIGRMTWRMGKAFLLRMVSLRSTSGVMER